LGDERINLDPSQWILVPAHLETNLPLERQQRGPNVVQRNRTAFSEASGLSRLLS